MNSVVIQNACVCVCVRTDFQLALDAPFASFAVVGLRAVVFRHDLDKFTRQCRMLRLAYPQVGR